MQPPPPTPRPAPQNFLYPELGVSPLHERVVRVAKSTKPGMLSKMIEMAHLDSPGLSIQCGGREAVAATLVALGSAKYGLYKIGKSFYFSVAYSNLPSSR